MTESLEQRIEEKLAAADRRIAEMQAKTEQDFREMQKRREQFKAVAGDLLDRSGFPMQQLADRFPNAELERSGDRTGRHVIVRFKHTTRFPATVEVKLDVAHDEEIRNVLILFDVSILPVFFDFERSGALSFPLAEVDEEKLHTWIEDRIVRFVQDYLRIQFVEEYQKENLVTDPVAAARFSRIFAKAEVEYRGNTYYFLSDETRKAFEADPESWVHV